MDIDTWLSGITDRMTAIQQRSAELTENMATATGTASAPDNSVTVEVGANGGLRNIQFHKGLEGRTPTQLSDIVMRTVRAAQRAATEKVTEAMEGLGADGDMLSRYVNYQPEPEPEEQREMDKDARLVNANFGVAPQEPAPEPAPVRPVQSTVDSQPVRQPRRPRSAQTDVETEEDNNPW